MNRIARFFLPSLALLLAAFDVAAAEVPQLRFRPDGSFKIMQITDLHYCDTSWAAERNDSTFSLISRLLDAEKPDLAVVTGDMMVWWGATPGYERLAQTFEDAGVPFAVTFGNHDNETDLTKDSVMRLLDRYPHSLSPLETRGLSGRANTALPILASQGDSARWCLYLLDSHNSTPIHSLGYYDWIKHDQIAWYRHVSDSLRALNGARPVPALSFFHIPLPEFASAKDKCGFLGDCQEGIFCSDVNSGLFASMMEAGDMAGVLVGHDHNNSYVTDYFGDILLGFGRKTGYVPAYDETLPRGVRLITLEEGAPAFTTYLHDDTDSISDRYYFERKNNATRVPQATGSFIQRFLVKDWDDARWDSEMAALKEAGIRYLVYGPSLEQDAKGRVSTTYPSKIKGVKHRDATLESCLRAAQKAGIRVFVGLNFNPRWWKFDYPSQWLNDQMHLGNQVANEILSLYKAKYPQVLYGWYWVWEVDNLNHQNTDQRRQLVDALNIQLDSLSALDPAMPLMLSPFFNTQLPDATPEAYADMWTDLVKNAHFRPGDIIAFQDGVGAGGASVDNLKPWFTALRQAVKSRPGMKFWANTEIFDHKDWTSAPLDRVVAQMQAVDPLVDGIICFAYSHYYAPGDVDPAYHRAYCRYRHSGKVPADIPMPAVPSKGKSISR